jgi:hypothetical protein
MTALLSAESARLWTERALAIALLLQSIEFLQLRRSFADDGVWSWSVLKREHATLFAPLRACFAVLLPYRPFVFLLGVRIAASILLGLGFSWSALPLFCIQLAINVRFRGTFNGGSDSMTILLLLALGLSAPFGSQSAASIACLFYVAVQATLSYFLAGIAKLKEAGWRSGATLGAFLNAGLYVVPPWALRFFSGSVRGRCFALGAIAFECGFPLALLRIEWCIGFLLAGLLFHVVNGLVLGLNRFLFAWAATYPAILFTSQQLAESALP